MSARAKSLAFARATAGLIRLDLAPPLRRLSCAILLAALAAPGAALAQCAPTTQPATLCSDQAILLSPFASLLNSPAGLAALEANMQTEEEIYAGASATRRTLAAENALVDQAPQSILIGAFPNNPNFYFNADGVPTTSTPIPSSVTTAVTSVTNNIATGANSGDLKSYFGLSDVYGIAYGNTTADTLGDPRPFQTLSAIADNPFTPANSSLIAYEISADGLHPHGSAELAVLCDVALLSQRTFVDRRRRMRLFSPSWRRDTISSCCSPRRTSATAATSSACTTRWT